MDYYFLAYILLAIFLELSVISNLTSQGRSTAAGLVGVFFLFIFIFFGRRWFTGLSTVKRGNCGTTTVGGTMKLTYSGPWPPVINMCPDYMVYFNRNGTTDTCVDISGVNRSGGALKAWTVENTVDSPPADDMKYFPYVYRTNMTDAQKTELCRQTMAAGLTWEGITDGEKCTFVFTDITAQPGTVPTSAVSNANPPTVASAGAALPPTSSTPTTPPPPPAPVPVAAGGASSAAAINDPNRAIEQAMMKMAAEMGSQLPPVSDADYNQVISVMKKYKGDNSNPGFENELQTIVGSRNPNMFMMQIISRGSRQYGETFGTPAFDYSKL